MFQDRLDAARQLTARLQPILADEDPRDVVVVGLPRGGVPVAVEIGRRQHLPVDVILVRKLGVPFQPELAMGAIGEGGVRVFNDDVLDAARVPVAQLSEIEHRERRELERRVRQFRGEQPRKSLVGQVVVVVDDGLATGATARAACAVARALGARRVVLAVPVAPADWVRQLGAAADDYVCVEARRRFASVGEFYRDFRPVTDDDVAGCLASAAASEELHPVPFDS